MNSPLVLALLLTPLALSVGCRRSEPAAVEVAAPDPRLAQRQEWFGPAATAADVQWRESGLGYRIIAPGRPAKPGLGATVRITYVGRLKEGREFARSDQPADFTIGGTIAGLSTGLQLLGAGGKATFFIPPSLGYGGRQVMGIPPNSGLIYDVEVLAVNP